MIGTLRNGIKVPSQNCQLPTKLSMSRQSSADCRREGSENLVTGRSVLLPALVLVADVAYANVNNSSGD